MKLWVFNIPGSLFKRLQEKLAKPSAQPQWEAGSVTRRNSFWVERGSATCGLKLKYKTLPL
jgi:hypothetical protein